MDELSPSAHRAKPLKSELEKVDLSKSDPLTTKSQAE
jgi:hypothetical protein